MKAARPVCLLVLLVLAIGGGGFLWYRLTRTPPLRLEKLGPIHARARQLTVSQDECHLAYVTGKERGVSVVHDGKAGPEYEMIHEEGPILSPDGKRVAYVVVTGNKSFVVADGKPGPLFDEQVGHARTGCPVFSPDSQHLAYRAKRDGKYFIVMDGEVSPPYDGAGCPIDTFKVGPVFSPDSQRCAYRAVKEGNYFIVVDGKALPTPGWRVSDGLTFSPDSKRLAYQAKKDDGYCVVVDGQPSPVYERITWGPVFSPDSRRAAFAARKGPHTIVVVDESPAQPFDRFPIGFGLPRFTANGKHLVYRIKAGDKHRVVVDEKPGPEYDEIGKLLLEPQGDRIAYTARTGKQWFPLVVGQPSRECHGRPRAMIFTEGGIRLACVVRKGSKFAVFVGQTLLGEHDDVGCIGFSPDGRCIAYAARKQAVWHVFVDGKPQGEYPRLGDGSIGSGAKLLFSPDGTRVAYVAQKSVQRRAEDGGLTTHTVVVVDGNEGRLYDGIWAYGPRFSPDSRHLGYFARKETKELLVLDGREGPLWDRVISDPRHWIGRPLLTTDDLTRPFKQPIFGKDNCVTYLAVKGGTLYRVTEAPADR